MHFFNVNVYSFLRFVKCLACQEWGAISWNCVSLLFGSSSGCGATPSKHVLWWRCLTHLLVGVVGA